MKKYLLLSVAVGALFFGQTALATTNDYTNYWTFDEGTGRSVGDLAGGQNGALTGSSTGFGWSTGKAGTALAMDGTVGESVVLPNSLIHGSEGTISVWFRLNSMSDHNVLLSGKSTTDNNIYFALNVNYDGRPELQYRRNSSDIDSRVQGMTVLNKNEWYNMVFTGSGLGYHMYMNGVDIGVAGANDGRWFPDFTNHTLMYRLGSIEASPLSGSLDGTLDDVRIYGRALSANEVAQLYTETNAIRPTVPVAIAPTLSFSISSDHVLFGGSVSLDWSATNVDSCVASGGWTNPVGLNGSQMIVKLGSDATYTLTCTGKGGPITKSVHVTVAAVGATSTPITSTSGGGITVTPVSPSTPTGTAPDYSGYVFTKTIKNGASGADVIMLQKVLIAKGFLVMPQGVAFGYFGGLTQKAVMNFQKSQNFAQVGFTGPLTRQALNAITAAK